MLYYICPMHTFFTWGVFIPLFLCYQYNDSFKVPPPRNPPESAPIAPPPSIAPPICLRSASDLPPICPTAFIASRPRSPAQVLFLKIALTFGFAYVLYDVPGVFSAAMDWTSPLLSFHDPLHPENSPMHEWFFRSGLDHLVWVFGMFCAFAFPWLDRQLQVRSPSQSPPNSKELQRAPKSSPDLT